jgi:hypothetical protein
MTLFIKESARSVQYGTVVGHSIRQTVLMQWFSPRAVDSVATIVAPARPSDVASRLWYRAPLADGPIGARHVVMIGEYFAEALGGADWPDRACLFLSGSDAIFFSPAAIAAVPHLIVACGAQPSLPPSRVGATMLAGRTSDWELLPYELH